MSNAQHLIDASVADGTAPFPIRFRNATYVFWHAVGGALTYIARATADGNPGAGQWQKSHELGAMTGGGVGILERTSPAAAVLNDRLYVFWHGCGRDGFFCSSTDDGQRWTAPLGIKGAIGGAMGVDGDADPCVAAYDGALHLFWRGVREREAFFHCSSRDGRDWHFHGSPQQEVGNMGAQPKTRPAAAVAGGKLYLLWSGSGKDGIFYATHGGGRWSSAVSLRDHIGGHGIIDGASPSACQLSDGFQLFWPGSGRDGIFWTANREGSFDRAQHRLTELVHPAHTDSVRVVEAPAIQGEEPLEIYWRNGIGRDTSRLYFRRIRNYARWMSRLPNNLSVGALNLPGSHDAAAIDRGRSFVDTDGGIDPFLWTCQNMSLSEQLAAGVRVLDIRIAAKLWLDLGTVQIMTCHGNLGLEVGLNLFQPFDTALDEVASFVADNPTETVILILKIDDEQFTSHPVNPRRPTPIEYIYNHKTGGKHIREEIERIIRERSARLYNTSEKPNLPSLGEARGKFMIFNRISGDYPLLGKEIIWQEGQREYHNWSRSSALDAGGERAPAAVTIAIQDRYEEISRSDKVAVFLEAGANHAGADVLINYASFTMHKVGKPLIQPELVAKTYEIGDLRVGWAMFDFVGVQVRSAETGEALNAIDFVIDRNRKHMN